MSREQIQDAARVSRFIAALLACIVLGRFALSSTAWATDRSKETRETERRRDEDRRDPEAIARKLISDTQKDNGQKRDVLSVKPEGSVESAPEATAPAPSGPPKRRNLLVDLGRPRSDVYVNGVHVGRTPYAGTWSCRDGDDVHIVVMGGSAAPIEAHAHCGLTISLDDTAQARKLDDEAVDELLGDKEVGAALKDALRSRTH